MKKFIVVLAVVVITGFAYGTVWDLGTAYNTNAINPNGEWSIIDGGTGIVLLEPTTNTFGGELPPNISWNVAGPGQTPQVGVMTGGGGSTTDFLSGDMGGHGPVGVKWTSPINGTVEVTGVVWNARKPGTADGRNQRWTLDDGTGDIWQAVSVAQFNDRANPLIYAMTYDVTVGQEITLVSAPAVNFDDFVGMTMTVTEIPEPMTIGLLGLGALSLLLRRKR